MIAATPQDFRWKGEDSHVVIGDNNVIREHVIINRSIIGGGATRIGSNSFVMAQSHIAHDLEIGDRVVIGNSVKVAGKVRIGDYTIVSSCALVHEGFELGKWVLIKAEAAASITTCLHIASWRTTPSHTLGVNSWVLRKAGKSEDLIDEVAKCYRHLYQSNTSPFNAVRRIMADVEPSEERDDILDFVKGHNYHLAAISLSDYLED